MEMYNFNILNLHFKPILFYSYLILEFIFIKDIFIYILINSTFHDQIYFHHLNIVAIHKNLYDN